MFCISIATNNVCTPFFFLSFFKSLSLTELIFLFPCYVTVTQDIPFMLYIKQLNSCMYM